MKAKVLLPLLLCIFVSSCESNKTKQEKKQQALIESAHSHNCMTLEEFCNLKYNYVYEKKLPCLVYLDGFVVDDVVSSVDLPDYVLKDYDDPYLGPGTEQIWFDWVGAPSNRRNECWMKGDGNSRQFKYIGLDKTQADWIISETRNNKTIHTPMIIRVYQVGFTTKPKSPHSIYYMSYTADLVEILNEE